MSHGLRNNPRLLRAHALLAGRDLSSLRALFVAGERCDPDTVAHFERLLGVPVVDHWWQTESGSPMRVPVLP